MAVPVALVLQEPLVVPVPVASLHFSEAAVVLVVMLVSSLAFQTSPESLRPGVKVPQEDFQQHQMMELSP